MAKKKLSDRNTKAEILTAYNALLAEQKSLLSQLKQAQAEQSATSKTQQLSLGHPPTAAQSNTPPGNSSPSNHSLSNRAQNSQTADPQEHLRADALGTMEAMLQSLDQVQWGFGNAVSGLSKTLTEQATQLSDIRALVTTEIEQLQTLHSLQADDVSLDGLLQEYEANFKTFTEELEVHHGELEQGLNQAKKSWEKEQTAHHRETQDRREAERKAQQREQQEYDYGISRDRQLSEDEFDQVQFQRYEALEEAKQAQDKAWKQREAELREQEQAFEILEHKVKAFPEGLKAAIKKATEEGKGIAHHQARVKADLLAKEIEGQRQRYELRIESLTDNLEDQDKRIQDLSEQLRDTLEQVQDLAVKAIEGASNVKSLAAMKEIALEQAKTPTKGK